MDLLKFLDSDNFTDRRLLKHSNHYFLDTIKDLFSQRRAPYTFVKVAAHVGIEGNELADQAAKAACNAPFLTTLPPTDKIYAFKDQTLLDMPIRKWIKEMNLHKANSLVQERLQRTHHHLQINVDLTLELFRQLKSVKYTEKSFFLKSLANMLPTQSRNTDWYHGPPESSTCARCGTFKETSFHVWTCQMNPKIEIKSETTRLIPH